MTLLSASEIKTEHLAKYWSVFAVCEAADAMCEVWRSNRLLPFLAAHSPSTLVEHLYIRVPSLNEDDLRPLRSTLDQVDHRGSKRQVRVPS